MLSGSAVVTILRDVSDHAQINHKPGVPSNGRGLAGCSTLICGPIALGIIHLASLSQGDRGLCFMPVGQARPA